MPIFIDSHEMKGFTEEKLKEIIGNPKDKHGVTHIELLYNKKEDKLFCILDGPDKDSIKKHHADAGLDCDFIIETEQIRTTPVTKNEKLSAIGELSARVAHDLRNPLGVIKNAIELIEMNSDDNTDEKLKKRITMIKNATEKMSRQINDVLDFVRIRPLQRENSSVLDIITAAQKTDVPENIKISLPKNDVVINCDSKQMEVVFTNLITNAVQELEEKGGKIKICINENQNDVIVEIEDSGDGISDENMHQIFDPLFTTKSGGTGLGLVSCKNIIEQHDGTISVKNNPTVFRVQLPKN